MIKKIILLLVYIIFFISCKKKSETVFLSITFENFIETEFKLFGNNYKKLIKSDKNGAATVILTIPRGGYYLLSDQKSKTIKLYLKKGDSVILSSKRNKKFPNSIKFNGNNIKENKYLLNYRKKLTSFYNYRSEISSLSPERFKFKIMRYRDSLIGDLYSMNLSKSFTKMVSKDFTYEAEYLLFKYLKSLKDSKANFSYNIIDLNNSIDYGNFYSYRKLILAKAIKEVTKNHKSMFDISCQEFEIFIKTLKIPEFRETFIQYIANGLITSKNKLIHNHFNYFYTSSNDSIFKEKIKQRYKLVVKNKKGNTSAKFWNFKGFNKQFYNLEDFIGSFIYIDIWATWCQPCVKEFESFNKLVIDYDNNNVKFIGISVDNENNKDKWRGLISKKKLKGIQLFSDKAFNSDFIEAYNILEIPRYILLDKELKIIDPDAPRPSTKEIKTLLDSLLTLNNFKNEIY